MNRGLRPPASGSGFSASNGLSTIVCMSDFNASNGINAIVFAPQTKRVFSTTYVVFTFVLSFVGLALSADITF